MTTMPCKHPYTSPSVIWTHDVKKNAKKVKVYSWICFNKVIVIIAVRCQWTTVVMRKHCPNFHFLKTPKRLYIFTKKFKHLLSMQ